ncbi:MAG: tellurite resistance protein [Thiomicrorhabdus sp.]|nr:MAG: tellurite resistance protein [Thiomicrorhabdus sp.]
MVASNPQSKSKSNSSSGSGSKADSKLAQFPISLFGAIMGFSGLTLGFTEASEIFGITPLFHQGLTVLTTVFFCLISIVYLMKLIKYPCAVWQEFNDPVALHFFPTFSVSLVLLSLLYQEIAPQIASILWHTGAAIQFALLLYIMNSWIHNEKWHITHMNPAWFIPVVGNILIPLGAPTFSSIELGWFFFSIGLIFWLILNSIVMYRLFFHPPLLKILEPTLFILIAPPAIGFASYMALTDLQILDNIARVLYYIALFLTILLLTQFRRFIKIPFALSWWAYTFPLGAITVASFMMYDLLLFSLFAYLALFFLLLLSLLVTMLTVKTLIAIKNGTLAGKSNPPQSPDG